jgi:hypothetical protein
MLMSQLDPSVEQVMMMPMQLLVSLMLQVMQCLYQLS